MTLRCPSCGVALKVHEEKLAGRTSARCPQCRNSVPIPSSQGAGASEGAREAAPILKVACGSCGARLRASAARAGTRSRCPKCQAEVLIQVEHPPRDAQRPRAASPQRPDDSSGAATRRIDSRMLGLPEAGPEQSPGAGMDLESFIRSTEPAPETAPAPPAGGIAATLMKPPVAEMEKIAGDIRQAAQGFAPSAPRPGTSHAPAAARAAGASVPLERAIGIAAKEPAPHHRPTPPRPDEASHSAALFPPARGLLFGALSGLLIGSAAAIAAALALDPTGNYLAPLPFAAALGRLPQPVLRAVLPLLLGALAGFIAAAIGSPTREERPLRLKRAVGFCLLVGLACGMVTSLTAGEGLRVWPMASWMRDLFLVGLVTSTLDRMVPVRR